MKRLVLQTRAFSRDLRSWLKSHPDTQDDILSVMRQLAENAHHPSLNTHKLRGTLDGCWSCSVDYDLRIIFRFIEHDGQPAVLLFTIGTHDEVY